MNWDHTEEQWLRIRGNYSQQSGDLSGEQPTMPLRHTYGNDGGDEGELDLSDWQERLHEIGLSH